MAVMHPVDIENYDYTPTEKEMYYALKEQLPDKYQVFYSVRWFETVDNKRIDSESDFLIFDPSFGFIALEVKGGTGITVVDGTLVRYSKAIICSPFAGFSRFLLSYHLNFCVFRKALAVPADAEKAVGPGQGGDQAGLAADGIGGQKIAGPAELDALILGPAMVGAEAFGEPGSHCKSLHFLAH